MSEPSLEFVAPLLARLTCDDFFFGDASLSTSLAVTDAAATLFFDGDAVFLFFEVSALSFFDFFTAPFDVNFFFGLAPSSFVDWQTSPSASLVFAVAAVAATRLDRLDMR